MPLVAIVVAALLNVALLVVAILGLGTKCNHNNCSPTDSSLNECSDTDGTLLVVAILMLSPKGSHTVYSHNYRWLSY